MRYLRSSKPVMAFALMAGFSFLTASGALAQEIEPNNACAAPQDLSTTALPLALQGSLDTPPATPDIDFYRFTAPPGSLVEIRMDGSSTGGGTLQDPYLAVLDANCGILAYNDDQFGLSSGLDLLVPANGTFVVAATSYGDFSFQGVGGYAGTYRLGLQVQEVARALGGRLVNLENGSPVSDASVSLLRCNATGDDCFTYVGATRTDDQGTFRFENGTFSVYLPLLAGTYRVDVTTQGYEATQAGPFLLSVGQDLNVGDIGVQPYPAVGSIRGRLVDEVTRQPLSGDSAPWANVDLIHCPFWGCYTWGFSEPVAADGTFRLTGWTNYLLPPGDFYVIASADQYQTTESAVFHVLDDQHFNAGDIPVKSNPARVTLLQPCGTIPSAGGTCRFTMRVTNGMRARMDGEFWAIVQGFEIGSTVQQTAFSVGSPRTLSLAPGASVDLQLSFDVPGEVSDGATICAKGFASQKPHKFNTLGAHDLFCLRKGVGGFTQVPESEKRNAVRRASGQTVERPDQP